VEQEDSRVLRHQQQVCQRTVWVIKPFRRSLGDIGTFHVSAGRTAMGREVPVNEDADMGNSRTPMTVGRRQERSEEDGKQGDERRRPMELRLHSQGIIRLLGVLVN